jgi:hypothetical protein
MSDYEYYLDYLNNFLTIEAFADYYHMSVMQAETTIINTGRLEAWDGIVKTLELLK